MDHSTRQFDAIGCDYIKKGEPIPPGIKKCTNPRYPFFRQNYFTAGDIEQFFQYWEATPCSFKKRKEKKKEIELHTNIEIDKYKNLCLHDIINTFIYISEKFKKGIFLKYIENKLTVFLPFSKVNFENEWNHKIKVNPKKYKKLTELIRYISKLEKKEFISSRFNYEVNKWSGNNGLVRSEFPISEGDNGLNMIRDMFRTLSQKREVPNIEYFVNKRDFPLLKKDGTESYHHFFGKQQTLLSHSFSKYSPILSMNTTDDHADIPIPTWHDWCIVSYYHEQKKFGKEYEEFPMPKEFESIAWKDKKPTIIFRGASTGLGVSLETNPRLFFSRESQKNKRNPENGELWMDVGITKWNLRPRISEQYPYLDTIDISKLGIPLSPYVTPLEQSKYKYVLHLPGHSCAYRLSLELYYGSVLFIYPCDYKLWYFDHLQPWVHYIPLKLLEIDKEDLYKKLEWCTQNEEQCQKIAENARTFAKQWITMEKVLDYLSETLWKIAEVSYPKIYLMKHSHFKLQKEQIQEHMKSRENMFDQLLEIGGGITEPSASTKGWNDEMMEMYFYDLEKKEQLIPFFKKIEETEQVFYSSKNTQVFSFELNGKDFLLKKTAPNWKQDEWNQVLLSKFYLNPLKKKIPQLMYVYHATHFVEQPSSPFFYMILEHKKGITLEAYITQNGFRLHHLVMIWKQIILCLQELKQNMVFSHIDLYPWNIIVEPLSSPIFQVFHIGKEGFAKYCFKEQCSIIDYGKSFFIHDLFPFYSICPFFRNHYIDITILILSSLHHLLIKQYIPTSDHSNILKIMNWWASHCQEEERFSSISQIKFFLKHRKKFSNILQRKKNVSADFGISFLHFLDSLIFCPPHDIKIKWSSLENTSSSPLNHRVKEPNIFPIRRHDENNILYPCFPIEDWNFLNTCFYFHLDKEFLFDFYFIQSKVWMNNNQEPLLREKINKWKEYFYAERADSKLSISFLFKKFLSYQLLYKMDCSFPNTRTLFNHSEIDFLLHFYSQSFSLLATTKQHSFSFSEYDIIPISGSHVCACCLEKNKNKITPQYLKQKKSISDEELDEKKKRDVNKQKWIDYYKIKSIFLGNPQIFYFLDVSPSFFDYWTTLENDIMEEYYCQFLMNAEQENEIMES
ncbi:MAG: hypothetical protein EBZ74_10790 [Planctomycetia bacterium]|nr:hypothetical protein [Planctomycetia bacterium]